MHDSIHRSPWPSLDEFAAVAAPKSPQTYQAMVAVIEAVRKAKAEANLSMKAPVAEVRIVTTNEIRSTLDTTRDDIARMLQIQTITINEGKPEVGLLQVEARL